MSFQEHRAYFWLIIWMIAFKIVNSKIVLLFSEDFEDCTAGGPASHFDVSGLGYEYVNDTTYFLDGKCVK